MVLLWLLPTVVVTVVAMLWAAWWGRASRGEVDRDEALRRLTAALDGPARRRRRRNPGYAAPRVVPDRSTGVAVRRTRADVRPGMDPVVRPSAEPDVELHRRAG